MVDQRATSVQFSFLLPCTEALELGVVLNDLLITTKQINELWKE